MGETGMSTASGSGIALGIRGRGGGSGSLGLGPLALLLVRSQGAQLEGVDAALAVHLVLEEGVYHAVAGGLQLGLEGVGDDDESRRSSDVSAGRNDGRVGSGLAWAAGERGRGAAGGGSRGGPWMWTMQVRPVPGWAMAACRGGGEKKRAVCITAG